MLMLRLRWAVRDARAHWVQVAAIALMIAMGTGLFAGLSSVTRWRVLSNEASFALTNVYDLRVELSGASFLPRGALEAAAHDIAGVAAASERLIIPTQVDVAHEGGAVFVPGRLVGVDLTDDGPAVNGVVTVAGRAVLPDEWGEPVVSLERNFGVFYDLPTSGTLRVSGGETVEYVGHAVSPEYFVVIDQGGFFGQANLAVLFTSIETVQALSGRAGIVNDLVLTVAPGADVDSVEQALAGLLAARFPSTGARVMRIEDDPAYRSLTQDPEGDQQFYNVFAFAIFAGAAFAALNLAARMVEARRREIGTSMALGESPRSIAVRPLLVGLQMSVLGVLFGVGIGLLVGAGMKSFLQEFIPLPVFVTPFPVWIFAQVSALGLAVPMLAVLWPVWRAVRVAPVDAIRTGHLASRGGGLAPAIGRLPLPGGSLGRMPFRNLLRAPRRTLLTLLALTAVIGILVGLVGMIDSLFAVIERGDDELLAAAPDRVVVDLDDFYAAGAPELDAALHSGALAAAEPGLTLSGSARNGGESIGLLLQFIDFDSGLWRPTAESGSLATDRPGVVIARKAADDLGVGAGDVVTLTHPTRAGPATFTFDETEMEVLAVHPHPLRFNAYLHVGSQGLVGLDGAANVVYGVPAEGGTVDSVKRALFDAEGVRTVQGVAASSQVTRDFLDQFIGVFTVIEAFVLGLALLIAFNTANINAEERARDHATMFAFGVPVRRVLLILATEGLALGAVASLFGAGVGYVMVYWIVEALYPRSVPELGIVVAVDNVRLAGILAGAVAVVAAAPALTARKLRRMNVPATLRVLE